MLTRLSALAKNQTCNLKGQWDQVAEYVITTPTKLVKNKVTIGIPVTF